MLRELSPCEERRQAFDRSRVERQVVEDAGQVLVRGLRSATRDAVRSEHALEPGVRGDDGAARVGFGPQVVERLVEHVRELLCEGLARAPAARGAAFRDDVRDDAGDNESGDQRDRKPRNGWLVRGYLLLIGRRRDRARTGKGEVALLLARGRRLPAAETPPRDRREEAKERERREQSETGNAPPGRLAGYRLPLRQPVEKEHPAGEHPDEPKREERVEERLGGRPRIARAARCRSRGGDRDERDEPEHEERR